MTTGELIQVILMGLLVVITGIYAWRTFAISKATEKQAEVSLKMAEEMREQRYDAVRPVIDIQRHLGERLRESLAAQSEEFSYGLWCILRNIGVGPAIDLCSYIQTDFGRQLRAFGTLPIGEATPKERLSLEQTSERMVLVAYYKDVHGRDFESRREVTLHKETSDWKIGPLETEVRKLSKEEPTK